MKLKEVLLINSNAYKLLSAFNIRELNDCYYGGKSIRLEIYIKDIPLFEDIFIELGLNFSVSCKSILVLTDKSMDAWSSTLEECSDDTPNAMRFVYIHHDKNICDQAKIYDQNNDDLKLGLVLQYPKCCIDAYCKWQTDNEDIDPITTITNALPFEGRVSFYDFPNPFSRYFGLGLYSHFPCSLTCEETKRIAEKSLNSLRIHFSIVAEELIRLENSLVIFQKDQGLVIWTWFSIEDNVIKLSRQSFQGQGRLKEKFRAVKEIVMAERELLLISNIYPPEVFTTEGCFIGAFTR